MKLWTSFCFKLLLICLTTSLNCSSQNRQIDSLKQVLATTKIDSVKVWSCIFISRQYQSNSEFNNALVYCHKAYALAQTSKKERLIHLALSGLQRFHLDQRRDADSSYYYIMKKMGLAKGMENPVYMGYCYFQLYYLNTGLLSNHTDALKYIDSALTKFYLVRDSSIIIEMLGRKIDELKNCSVTAQIKGVADKNEFDQLIKNTFAEMERYSVHRRNTIEYLQTKSKYYQYFQKYDSAIFIRKKILDQIKLSGGNDHIAYSMALIGGLYGDKGDYKKAIEWGRMGLEFSKAKGLLKEMEDNLSFLSMNYEKAGMYKEALHMYQYLIHFRDSISSGKSEQVKSKYELGASNEMNKEKAELYKKESELNEARASYQRSLSYLFIGILGLVIIFTMMMINRWRVEKKQKNVIEVQKQLIESKHKEITDSINYAERIQRSFLATEEQLKNDLSEYFIMFQPKDVVSGDFYWAKKLNNGDFVLCCADSTGHGVPGSIMSILNIYSLEKAVETKNTPAQILNEARHLIIERLKNDGSAEGGKDGMDCSLLVFNKERTRMYSSAANNPIWIIRNKEVIEIAPNRMPVGKHEKDQIPFEQNEFELHKGDLIYALTDGFPDQFGGEKGKKYKHKKLKEFLLGIASLKMEEQKERLLAEFLTWKGNLEQVDDVCVVGIKI